MVLQVEEQAQQPYGELHRDHAHAKRLGGTSLAVEKELCTTTSHHPVDPLFLACSPYRPLYYSVPRPMDSQWHPYAHASSPKPLLERAFLELLLPALPSPRATSPHPGLTLTSNSTGRSRSDPGSTLR